MIKYKLNEDKETVSLSLIGEMTIEKINELKQLFDKVTSRGREINLDIESVENIDIAGLQLICSLHRTAYENQQKINWKGEVSPKLQEILDTIGIPFHQPCTNLDHNCCFVKKGENE